MNVAVFTTTRAEFGILYPLIKKLEQSKVFNLSLFVGGTHLSADHGYTIAEITGLGIKVTDTFDFVPKETNQTSILNSLAVETQQLSEIFQKYTFHVVCLLGDRYELLPIIQASILFQKPIVHIHGGEKSEGVIDEQIRHMITKSAHIHFAACEEYADNIRRMGEQDWRVYNVGALAVDNMSNNDNIPKDELYQDLHLDLKKKLILFTYHPVTLSSGISTLQQIQNIFEALKNLDYQVLITSPNIESDRDIIINEIIHQVEQNSNYHYIESLGVKRYLSVLTHCSFVVGNSSSGIIEVPYFKIPTINIGDRQRGRLRHDSIIDTNYTIDSICNAIKKAEDPTYVEFLRKMKYKFGDGNTADKMVNILEAVLRRKDLLNKELSFS